jgi:hypothetical protein
MTKEIPESLKNIMESKRARREEERARFDQIPESRKARIELAYEYLRWLPRITLRNASLKYNVNEDEILYLKSDKSRTQQAYEYYMKTHRVSMRVAGEKFGVSAAAVSYYKSELEGKLTNRTERRFLRSEHSDLKILHGYRCYMCLRVFAPQDLEIDHWDGDRTNDEWGNLVPLCKECHARKTWGKIYRRSIAFFGGKPSVDIAEYEQEEELEEVKE